MKIIDLSVRVNQNTPVYPGDPKTVVKPAGDIVKDGYCDHFVSLGTHVGTHIDAPMHMIREGKSLNEFAIDKFVGKGKVVQVVGDNFEVVKNANIQPGDIVLFCTDTSKKYYEAEYFEAYPAMSQEVADYLVGKKIKIVGVDTCSVDNEEDFRVHKTLLAGDVLIIENLTNLEQLVGKDCKIYALPLNLDIDGAPARVIAEVAS